MAGDHPSNNEAFVKAEGVGKTGNCTLTMAKQPHAGGDVFLA